MSPMFAYLAIALAVLIVYAVVIALVWALIHGAEVAKRRGDK